VSDAASRLAVMDALREPVLRAAIQALDLSRGSRGLDAGCGIGQPSVLLAEAVGSGGRVTGLDLSPRLLVKAKDNAEKGSSRAGVSLTAGDIHRLPLASNAFDWAWSADCVGYAPLEPLPLLRELVRVVKPGGLVAILAWSSETLLPGYPLLEARLRATAAGVSPFARGKRPELHFPRLLGWLRAAGLVDTTVHTLAGGVHAPLMDDQRDALVALFQMRWPGVQAELAAGDWAEFRRLCLPESDEFIVYHADYYAFFTYSLFAGRVAG